MSVFRGAYDHSRIHPQQGEDVMYALDTSFGREAIALIGIGITITIPYFIAGIGCARLIARIKAEDIRLKYICFWPFVLWVYAACGDVE
jgi:hypothetical protein